MNVKDFFAIHIINTKKILKHSLYASHGMPDGGAVGARGTIEQEINLAVTQKISEVLRAKNINVILTRTDENGLWTNKSKTIREKKVEDMNNRLKIIKKSDADLFITIHMNTHTNNAASGLRIFYSEKFAEIKPLAENIQYRMSDITGAVAGSIKTADKSLFLLKNSPIPSILIECGFISNPEEEEKLSNDEYRSRLAWAVADAIEKYCSSHQINR